MKALLKIFGVGAILGLSACVVTPARYGYGGSGYYAPPMSLDAARSQCVNAASAAGYAVAGVRDVDQTGPYSARVDIAVRGPYGGRGRVNCAYNGRTGVAYVR